MGTNELFYQRMERYNGFAIVISFLLAPIPTVLILILLLLIKRISNLYRFLRWYQAAVLIALIISIVLAYNSEFTVPSIEQWIIGAYNGSLIYPLFTGLTVSVYGAGFTDSGQRLIEADRKRRAREIKTINRIPEEALKNGQNIFIAGTTGSGKTSAILSYVYHAINMNIPIFIISGKANGTDPHGLLTITRELAEKHRKPLYLVSLNPAENSQRYNPLQGLTAGEAADTLIELCEFSEPYYRSGTLVYLKLLTQAIIEAKIPLSLQAIIDFYDWNNYSRLIQSLQQNGKITAEEARRRLTYKEKVYDIAKQSEARYMNIIAAEGGRIYGDTPAAINAQTARDSNGIFYLDLDSFAYGDFTRSIGAMAIHDIAHTISRETHGTAEQRKLIIWDEVSAYLIPRCTEMYSRARSAGYSTITATQSLADIDAVSPIIRTVIMENSSVYFALQLNDPADAETMAGYFGTRQAIEDTYRTADLLTLDGAGTKRIVREYRVSPDDLKELPPLTGYYYNKRQAGKIYLLHIPFIKP